MRVIQLLAAAAAGLVATNAGVAIVMAQEIELKVSHYLPPNHTFQKALTERIRAGDVLTVEKFAVTEIKTKAFVAALKKQTDAKKVLLISDSFDEKTFKSASNVKPVRLTTAVEVNTEQLLAFDKILVTHKALEKLAERTSASAKATA